MNIPVLPHVPPTPFQQFQQLNLHLLTNPTEPNVRMYINGVRANLNILQREANTLERQGHLHASSPQLRQVNNEIVRYMEARREAERIYKGLRTNIIPTGGIVLFSREREHFNNIRKVGGMVVGDDDSSVSSFGDENGEAMMVGNEEGSHVGEEEPGNNDIYPFFFLDVDEIIDEIEDEVNDNERREIWEADNTDENMAISNQRVQNMVLTPQQENEVNDITRRYLQWRNYLYPNQPPNPNPPNVIG